MVLCRVCGFEVQLPEAILRGFDIVCDCSAVLRVESTGKFPILRMICCHKCKEPLSYDKRTVGCCKCKKRWKIGK